jgi:hypothetical protein
MKLRDTSGDGDLADQSERAEQLDALFNQVDANRPPSSKAR